MPDIIEITAIIFQLLFINSIIVFLKVVKIVKVSVPQPKNKNVQQPMQNSAKLLTSRFVNYFFLFMNYNYLYSKTFFPMKFNKNFNISTYILFFRNAKPDMKPHMKNNVPLCMKSNAKPHMSRNVTLCTKRYMKMSALLLKKKNVKFNIWLSMRKNVQLMMNK